MQSWQLPSDTHCGGLVMRLQAFEATLHEVPPPAPHMKVPVPQVGPPPLLLPLPPPLLPPELEPLLPPELEPLDEPLLPPELEPELDPLDEPLPEPPPEPELEVQAPLSLGVADELQANSSPLMQPLLPHSRTSCAPL